MWVFYVGLKVGVEFKVSNRIVQRVLNEARYHYFQSCKKGLLTEQDLKGTRNSVEKLDIKNLIKLFGTQ